MQEDKSYCYYYPPMNQRLRETLLDARKLYKLKQSDLATLLGVHQTHISQIESGARAGSAEFWQTIARIFGLEIIAVKERNLRSHLSIEYRLEEGSELPDLNLNERELELMQGIMAARAQHREYKQAKK